MDACPNCNSKSGVDAHGRQFCHACHKDFPGKGRDLLPQKSITKCTIMPEIDSLVNDTLIWPPEAFYYLHKYYIDDEQLRSSGAFWSNRYKRICFPYYQEDYKQDKMIACHMRSLTEQPKWRFVGTKDFCWLLFTDRVEEDERVVYPYVCLVEDVLSAIRVSKYIDCICLGGTSINMYTRETLNDYKNVYIFLDGDEAGKKGAEKIRKELKLTHNVKVIRAKKDPKEFDNEWLKEILL